MCKGLEEPSVLSNLSCAKIHINLMEGMCMVYELL